MRYLRERERADERRDKEAAKAAKDGEGKEGAEGGTGEGGEEKKQEVYVLDGGFVKWQEEFGDDEVVTEGCMS